MRKSLSKKEIKELNDNIFQKFAKTDFLDKKLKVELVDNIVEVNNGGWFFYYNQELVPTLRLLLKNQILKEIVVDMGAVKFVCEGADIMRPGIKSADETIIKEEYVCVVDEKHHKPLAVGKALFSGSEIMKAASGKMVKNVHYIGDEVWGKE